MNNATQSDKRWQLDMNKPAWSVRKSCVKRSQAVNAAGVAADAAVDAVDAAAAAVAGDV